MSHITKDGPNYRQIEKYSFIKKTTCDLSQSTHHLKFKLLNSQSELP